MNRRRLSFARAVCAAVSLGMGGIAGAGPLEPPPGPVAPTMKTLDQVEARKPIHQGDLPLTISVDGSYYLAENLVANQNGVDMITVVAENVSIDLNGFTIKGTNGGVVASDCIEITPTAKTFALKDGIIRECGQNGVVTNVWYSLTVSVTGVQAIQNGQAGLQFGSGTYGRISDSVARGNGSRGILLNDGVIEGSVTIGNTGIGLQTFSGMIRGCVTKQNGTNMFAGGLTVDTLAQ